MRWFPMDEFAKVMSDRFSGANCGDPVIDWSKIRTSADIAAVEDCDVHAARVVGSDVFGNTAYQHRVCHAFQNALAVDPSGDKRTSAFDPMRTLTGWLDD